eukprot:TCALIF_10633-PA protein Name:"Similar to FZD1 Frizzled-1 (Gallus gallus)" AED:0.08 eAED:0.08 QI:0/0/0/0.8/1/1/5/0/575
MPAAWCTAWVLSLGLSVWAASDSAGVVLQSPQCELITMDQCQHALWTNTTFPNLMGHLDQETAGQQLRQYAPLISIKCSPDVLTFLCSMYAPVCTIMQVPPCRELCLSVKAGCEKIMNQFNYDWPDAFACHHFPPDGTEGQPCMNKPLLNQAQQPLYESSWAQLPNYGHSPQITARPAVGPGRGGALANFTCPVQLQMPREFEYRLHIGSDQVIADCGAPCYHNVTFFNRDQIQFAQSWIGSWSVVCLISCLVTLLTYIIDRGRFPYPERPIIYLALCYGCMAVIYLIGFGHGDSIACNPAVPNRTMNFLAEKTIKQGTLHDWRCTLSAMGLYFFFIAGSLWWVILTITWFLSAALKWGQEAIDVKSQFFHTVAWTIPSILTSAMLITKNVEGDVLSGVCFVGLWSPSSLLYFLLVPLMSCLILGSLFLVFGYFSLIRIRTIMKQDGTKTDKLERLMIRIGIFSILYTLPALTIIICYLYEHKHMSDWTQKWQETICRDPFFQDKWQTPCRFPDNRVPNTPDPKFNVFLIKYFSIAMIGIISGFWVWCGKTLTTWKSFFQRLSGHQNKNGNSAYV